MSVTIGEVARLAGVSKATVSRVLNGKPDVKLETKERIEALIEELGFRPNVFAMAMSKQKSSTIGIIIPYEANYILSNPFYAEVLRGISTSLNAYGYYQLLCYHSHTNYVDVFKQKRVDGFILLSPGGDQKVLAKALNEAEAPFSTTSRLPDEENVIYVDVDNYYGATMAVDHLVSLGHRRIGCIMQGLETLASSKDRLRGYKDVLAKHSISYSDSLVKVYDGNNFIENGYRAMGKFFQDKMLPTAIFAANDMMAIGAIQAIKEKGLEIPKDISIVGFDDVPLAKYINPPLTTVSQPAFEKGKEAARLVIEMIDRKVTPAPKLLDVELSIRQSTGRCFLG
ncbi:MAG: LacI family DNA-binding transcriptional regulator [Dethiobacter sp.]|nr:LacI family DNA-binding transcriptional regulator [Dethiobacter sp.]